MGNLSNVGMTGFDRSSRVPTVFRSKIIEALPCLQYSDMTLAYLTNIIGHNSKGHRRTVYHRLSSISSRYLLQWFP